MAESSAFSVTCEALERGTSLDRLEARGTVRIALKQAGLDPASVTGHEMSVVLSEILEAELSTRGVDDARAVCEGIQRSLASLTEEGGATRPETVFARLGGPA
jgi:hypothetical protein